MGKTPKTIYDISKELGLSAATVSRALNGNPKISEKTRQLVLKTADAMDYKKNSLALALKSGKTSTVGVVVPYINHHFFSSVIRGIEEELYQKNFQTIICQSHEDVELEEKQINNLIHTQVDCIFLSIAKKAKNSDHLKRLVDSNIPLIFFDRKMDIPGVSSITLDDYKGGYMATEHLIKQGCKKIAHFHGDMNLEIYRNRFEGFKKALSDYKIDLNENHVIQVESDIELGKKAIKKLWKQKNLPDGLFASSDYVAMGAIKALNELKVKIPEEVCICGFSNEPFTQFMETQVTTIDQNAEDMGRIAAQVFIEKMEKKSDNNLVISVEKKVVLQPKLIVRDSTKRKKL